MVGEILESIGIARPEHASDAQLGELERGSAVAMQRSCPAAPRRPGASVRLRALLPLPNAVQLARRILGEAQWATITASATSPASRKHVRTVAGQHDRHVERAVA